MIDLGRQTLELDCPSCKRRFNVSLSQIANQALIKCNCGQEIQLKDNNGKNKKVINDVNKSLKDMENAFKKLGR